MSATIQQLLLSYGNKVNVTNTANTSSGTDLTTYTFTTQSIGAADPNRVVVCCVFGGVGSAGRTISSVTIGGVTATAGVTAISGTSGGSWASSIYYARVPTGTTATVEIVWSGSMGRCGISLYRLITRGSIAPSATASDVTYSSGVLSNTINCPPNGAIIACGYGSILSTTNITWSGVTEDVEGVLEASTERYGSASGNFDTNQSGLTVSATWNGSSQTDGSLTIAAWSP